MHASPELVFAGRAELAEGPVWHDGALWWVDIVAGTLNRLDVRTGQNVSRATGGFLGCAVPATDGRWLLGRRKDCAWLNWQSGEITPLTSALPRLGVRHRLNDGKCDPAGRFFVGSMSLDAAPGEAVLLRVGSGGAAEIVREGVSLSNGLAWSPSGDVFYHVDTPARTITRFDFDAGTGTLHGGGLLAELGEHEGWPDGLCCDSEGHLWVGLWAGHAVVRLHGRTGALLERHALPVSNVSSCTFGGSELKTLFVTTAWEGFSMDRREHEPLAGSIFAIDVSTPGLPVSLFRAERST